MSVISIRLTDSSLAEKLQERATQHGLSMEDEAVAILRAALESTQNPPANLAASIRARFAPLDGIELTAHVREPIREPMDFG